MAALRRGISTVIIPEDNARDLEQIDQTVRSALNFVTANNIETVLNTALNRKAELTPTLYRDFPDEVKNKPRKPEISQ